MGHKVTVKRIDWDGVADELESIEKPKASISKRNWYGILGCAFAGFLMLGASLGIMISAVTPPPNIPTVIEPGSMVGDATYVIFKEGTTYYAKNGTTGAIEDSGTTVKTLVENALITLGITGGSIVFASGVFTSVAPTYIAIPEDNIQILGQGESTVFSNIGFSVSGSSFVARDFKLIGRPSTTIAIQMNEGSDGFLIEDIIATGLNSSGGCLAAFGLIAITGVIDGGMFLNCKAIDCGTFGFFNGATGSMSNISYINCEAINSGRFDRLNAWVTGFDFSESMNLTDIYATNCKASGSWESGFHIEPFGTITRFIMTDCIAMDNGQKPIPVFGNGFTLAGSVFLSNCISMNNTYCGFEIIGESHLINCISENNGASGFVLDADDGHIVFAEGCRDNGSLDGLLAYGVSEKANIYDFVSHYPVEKIATISGFIGGVFEIAGYATGGDATRVVFLNAVSNASFELNIVDTAHVNYAVYANFLINCLIGGSIVSNASDAPLGLQSCSNTTVKNMMIDARGGAAIASAIIVAGSVDDANYIVDSILADLQVAPTMEYGVIGYSPVIVDRRTVAVIGTTIGDFGGTNTSFLANWGHKNVTGAFSTLTVDHSVSATPNVVTVTCNNTGAGLFALTSITSTQFVITFTNQPATSVWEFYWYAEVCKP